jgi:hypothetical protein
MALANIAGRKGPERPDAICVLLERGWNSRATGTVPTKTMRCNARMVFAISRAGEVKPREPAVSLANIL